MLPAQVAQSYDQIAYRWASPELDRSDGIEQHKRAVGFISRRGAALDVGCGSSGRFFDLLRSQGFAVEGLDLSSEMLRIASARHPQVALYHAGICTWTPSRSYEFISAWDSIWHVPLPKQPSVLLKLCNALVPGGVFTSLREECRHPASFTTHKWECPCTTHRWAYPEFAACWVKVAVIFVISSSTSTHNPTPTSSRSVPDAADPVQR